MNPMIDAATYNRLLLEIPLGILLLTAAKFHWLADVPRGSSGSPILTTRKPGGPTKMP
jgi:hypothetical protein